ncbi:MAG: hypothetical protein OEZ10_02035 [Gammaproteobacteria bacterium]|nr:hypothetical protein [Gammaproteobacteria bacterium]
MSSTKIIDCILWDFGDTLSVWRGGSPEWMTAYKKIEEKIGISSAWNLGLIETEKVLTLLAETLKITESEVYNHLMREDLFEFFPFTHNFFMSRHLPQSIVTINPPLFREMTAPLGLDDVISTIVISGEEGTLDKGVLCEIALQRMNINSTNDRVLLIDNLQANLDSWMDRGGIGYLFTNDSEFQKDVANGIDGLASRI